MPKKAPEHKWDSPVDTGQLESVWRTAAMPG
jgi:hypothetical protein